MIKQTIKNLQEIIAEKEAAFTGEQEHDINISIQTEALKYAITKLEQMENKTKGKPGKRMTMKTAGGYEFTDDLLYGPYAEELLQHVGSLEDEAEKWGWVK